MFFQNNFSIRADKLGVLAENYPHGCQIYILWVQRNIFRAAFLKQVFKHFNFFEVLVKFPWQEQTIVFIVDKIAKKCLEEQSKKNLLREKKSTSLVFFKILSGFFAFSEKFMAWLSKLQPKYLQKSLRKNSFFLKWNMFANIFGLADEKNRAFSQKVFFRVFTTRIRASRELFWGKMISLSKKFYFFLSFMEYEWFLCLSCKIFH